MTRAFVDIINKFLPDINLLLFILQSHQLLFHLNLCLKLFLLLLKGLLQLGKAIFYLIFVINILYHL